MKEDKVKLNDYRAEIMLDEDYQPTQVQTSLDELLDYLLNEMTVLERVSIQRKMPKQSDKRQLIKAILTIRPAGSVTEELVEMVDGMLQNEIMSKTITSHERLPREDSSYPGVPIISVWNGDIATLKIDAIVNAANSQMEGCFVPFHNCIDNVIHNAAGIQLREDCSKIMHMQGHIEDTADAKLTRAYNLPSKYVIHTVGPIVSGKMLTNQDKEALEKTYEACLNLVKESGLIKSIAFCSISTGVFGFPFEPAAKIALKTVAKWLEENPDCIDHVVFNTFGDEATRIYKTLINDWKE